MYELSVQAILFFKKYIGDETLSALEGMFYWTDEEAYIQARDILHKRYGHPFVIQRAFREKLNSWLRIGPRESFKLGDFSDFLVTCNSTMPHIPGLQVLNDCEENQKLLKNVPIGLLNVKTNMSLKLWIRICHIQASRNLLSLWLRKYVLQAMRFPPSMP